MLRVISALLVLVFSSAAMAAPEARGLWTGKVDARIVGDGLAKRLKADASLVSTEKGAVFFLRSRGEIMCIAAFEPAETLDAMTFAGTDCVGVDIFGMKAMDGGNAAVAFRMAKTEIVVPMTRGHDGTVPDPSATPKSATDLRGITLTGTAQEMMEAVAAEVEPRDPANPWREDIIEGVKVYDFVSPRTGYMSTIQDERFLLLVADHNAGMAPYGMIRWWNPQEADEPTLGSLRAALSGKYGEPSMRYDASGDLDRGMVWSFAPDGTKLGAEKAEQCSRQKPAGARESAAMYRQVWNFDASLRKMEMPVRPGCGLQMVVNYPMQDAEQPVDMATFLVFDPQRLAASLWYETAAEANRELANLKEAMAAEAEKQAEMNAVQPTL